MKELYTEIVIQRQPINPDGVVVLNRLNAYAEWNPFIHRLQGPALAGARLNVTVRPPGGKVMAFHPAVLISERNHELRWMGRQWVPEPVRRRAFVHNPK